MRLWLAIRAFFAVLLDSRLASVIEPLLREGGREGPATAPTKEPSPSTPDPGQMTPRPLHTDAITLLAALQREARFLDIVKEPLTGYSDEQVGAAARDVLRDCGVVLDRFFAIQPLVEDLEEGAELETPAKFDSGRYRLTGNVTGDPPYRGRLVHHGWRATRCDLPQWSGSEQSARVIAPVELEIS